MDVDVVARTGQLELWGNPSDHCIAGLQADDLGQIGVCRANMGKKRKQLSSFYVIFNGEHEDQHHEKASNLWGVFRHLSQIEFDLLQVVGHSGQPLALASRLLAIMMRGVDGMLRVESLGDPREPHES